MNDEDIPYPEQFAAVVAEIARRANTTEHAVHIAYATLSCLVAGDTDGAEDNIRMAGEESPAFRAGVLRALDILADLMRGAAYARDAGNNLPRRTREFPGIDVKRREAYTRT
jgi:hypothetical protein